jgi:hypothetical protein
MPGPAPKPASQRRRRNKPASYGAAEPVTAGTAAQQPRLGFKCHRLVRDMWRTLAASVEAKFYSDADWERARWEMFYANQLLTGDRPLTASAYATVQRALSDLLASPADKRRAGIALKPPGVDADEVAAAEQIGSTGRGSSRSDRGPSV